MVDNKNNVLETNQDQTDSVQKKIGEPSAPKANTAGGQAQNEQVAKGIDFLLDVPLQVSVEVGRTKMLIKDFLKMKEGGVIELDEAVVVNEKFGLRLIDVVSTLERLEKLR